MDKRKASYDFVEIEIIRFSSLDIVTSSNDDDYDDADTDSIKDNISSDTWL